MNEEIRVSVQSEGKPEQWAKGLFYRTDGKKSTLNSKSLKIIGIILFIGVSVALVLQGTPEKKKMVAESQVHLPKFEVPTGKAPDISSVSPRDSSFHSETAVRRASKVGSRKQKVEPSLSGPQLIVRPQLGKIPPGSFIRATLLTGASQGPVRAEASENLLFQGETLIEQGAILVGMAQSSNNRLTIQFQQLITRDGAIQTVQGQACDAEDQIVGLRGSRVGNEALKWTAGIGLSFVGGLTTGLQETEGQSGAVIHKPTMKNAMLNGAATATLGQAKEVISGIRNTPPVYEVSAGTPICILFSGS